MIEMCKNDNLMQILVGDERKQDQFEFFYESCKVLFDSALQDDLVSIMSPKGNSLIVDLVIPEMVAFKACMRIREIQLKKAKEVKKAKVRAEVLATEGDEEEEKKEEEEIPVPASPTKLTADQIKKLQMETFNTGGTLSLEDAMK